MSYRNVICRVILVVDRNCKVAEYCAYFVINADILAVFACNRCPYSVLLVLPYDIVGSKLTTCNACLYFKRLAYCFVVAVGMFKCNGNCIISVVADTYILTCTVFVHFCSRIAALLQHIFSCNAVVYACFIVNAYKVVRFVSISYNGVVICSVISEVQRINVSTAVLSYIRKVVVRFKRYCVCIKLGLFYINFDRFIKHRLHTVALCNNCVIAAERAYRICACAIKSFKQTAVFAVEVTNGNIYSFSFLSTAVVLVCYINMQVAPVSVIHKIKRIKICIQVCLLIVRSLYFNNFTAGNLQFYRLCAYSKVVILVTLAFQINLCSN